MMNDNFSHESNAHLALSFQLLHLLTWLVEHDDENVKKMIEKAFQQGAYRDFKKMNYHELDDAARQEMHHSVLDFFAMLEYYLEEVYYQHSRKSVKQKQLRSTIDHIDTNLFDDENLISSVENTTIHMEKNPQKNAQQMLYEELLKQWEPDAETILN